MSAAEQPEIGGTEPIVVDVVAGETYWWGRCGHPENKPFCDGSHARTSVEPMGGKAERSRPMSFCPCKRTKSPPFCDDSHDEL